MKNAISLPDALGHAADLYAAQRDMTRSELYARALSEYLSKHKHEDITEKINSVMAGICNSSEGVGETGLSSIRNLEW
jgi:metal-responsive CopG/Arc/MetJ family transcriptional regulator